MFETVVAKRVGEDESGRIIIYLEKWQRTPLAPRPRRACRPTYPLLSPFVTDALSKPCNSIINIFIFELAFFKNQYYKRHFNSYVDVQHVLLFRLVVLLMTTYITRNLNDFKENQIRDKIRYYH